MGCGTAPGSVTPPLATHISNVSGEVVTILVRRRSANAEMLDAVLGRWRRMKALWELPLTPVGVLKMRLGTCPVRQEGFAR
jgi:hypothetical protein